MFEISIDGEELDSYNVDLDDGATRVQVEDIARSSGFNEDCRWCGEEIWEEDGKWTDGSTVVCAEHTRGVENTYGADETSPHEPPPLAWCNSASVTLDPEDNAVHLSCSVGDPRGAFTFTVRQLPDGKIIIHTPYPGEGMPHMDTVELHPGTLEVK